MGALPLSSWKRTDRVSLVAQGHLQLGFNLTKKQAERNVIIAGMDLSSRAISVRQTPQYMTNVTALWEYLN